ncbi:MAG: thymidine phosphorylase [Candidatus Komeilibacteria bacterium CG_4_10_14_0_2_um_filter_37_10]|uniref:Thymidine phosphorylase n=1 Tax=Candidatus Komeilibacteria bacterium CG_4_10_14_0_2_um_filter_37_10 TaxID=1974470 RepID=A0A2M7VFW3_9BACT|nr:MAG: thymidine phosphorylase [Candidatus Komeilibacteria bacterium CG_4_10_14_0_2_um_filter_37_10]
MVTPYYLKVKKLDFTAGSKLIVLINEEEAYHFGIHAGDKVSICWRGKKKLVVDINLSDKQIKPGEIGMYEEIWRKNSMENNEIVEMTVLGRPASIQAIKKKLLGHPLTKEDARSIVEDIATNRISSTEIAYFVAATFLYSYTDDELYYMTKSVAETGEIIKYSGTVVDKHSVGGIAGNRTTMVVIPIIASLGLKIPKTSSRAITSPAGTADTMEVLAPVSLSAVEMKEVVKKTNACMIWGGSFNLAPADDKMLKVTYPLSLEPYDKMIVSVMAKKVATNVKYLVIDMPVGDTAKILDMATADMLEKKFIYVAKRFGIKIKVFKNIGLDPIGQGIGPTLEARDVLRVLQQKEGRPMDLEEKSLELAAELYNLVKNIGMAKARKEVALALSSGKAWSKMKEIIKAQGGQEKIDSEGIELGNVTHSIKATKSGEVIKTDNKNINALCRILGAPLDKKAGIYLEAEYGKKVVAGQSIYTFYASNEQRMALALAAVDKLKIFTIK